jgi:endonuclease/exonuclease/phosphatase family metal-dependent hydrolase
MPYGVKIWGNRRSLHARNCVVARIDHVFVDPRFEVIGIEVPNTEPTRVASDHLPLIVEVRIPKLAEMPAAHDTDTMTTALHL